MLPARARAACAASCTAFGVASATLYAAGLAFGAESLARTSVSLLYVEEDRYRLLARNMSDVISRHRRNGAVQFISPAAETMLAAPVSRLLGHGLFDRVHVADRPAYLTALSDAARGGEARSVEFRLRRDAPRGNERGLTHPADFIWIEMRCRPLDQAAEAATAARGRSGRRHARRHRSQDAGAGARSGTDRRRAGGRIQEPLSRHHEPRIAHAAQRHHRFLRDDRSGRRADAGCGAPQGICPADQRFGPASAVGGQRHSRHVQDGVRQFRDRAGAVRAAGGAAQLLQPAGFEGARKRHRSA